MACVPVSRKAWGVVEFFFLKAPESSQGRKRSAQGRSCVRWGAGASGADVIAPCGVGPTAATTGCRCRAAGRRRRPRRQREQRRRLRHQARRCSVAVRGRMTASSRAAPPSRPAQKPRRRHDPRKIITGAMRRPPRPLPPRDLEDSEGAGREAASMSESSPSSGRRDAAVGS